MKNCSKTPAVLATLLILVLASTMLRAQSRPNNEAFCNFSSFEQAQRSIIPDTALARKNFVRALAIYVAFPEQETLRLPPVYLRVETEIPDFISKMSEGRQTLLVETALRPAPFEALCYVADSAMSYYQSQIPEPATKALGYEIITEEILDKVYADQPGFPARYDIIFLNLLGNFQNGSDGFAQLVKGKRWERRFAGVGATMDLVDSEVFLGVVAHEYGHLLGAQHPPHHLAKSFGDYELMDQNLHQLAPYSVQNLLDIGWLAPERVQIIADTLYNVELEDIRRGGKVVLIPLDEAQYFLVTNHQGSDYDARYKGRGLLIWHQAGDAYARRGFSMWDVESAAGLFTNGSADPNSGRDVFDLSRDSTGSAGDFFYPGGAARFATDTNPNTNFYDHPADNTNWHEQTRASGVALSNLRQVGTKMIFDACVPYRAPRITHLKGPNAVVNPNSFYPVQVWIENVSADLDIKLFFRHIGAQEFMSTELREIARGLYLGEILSSRVSTSVEYYVRLRDRYGRDEFFPAQAPDSLLNFIIRPYSGTLMAVPTREFTLARGDSVAAPVEFNNAGDLQLTIRNMFFEQENLADDRAYDAQDQTQEAQAARLFFNVQTQLQPSDFYERAPMIYLREPPYAYAVAKLHFTYDEKWLYIFFIPLKPRSMESRFWLSFVWRDATFEQSVTLEILEAAISTRASPNIPVEVKFLNYNLSPLPHLLIQVPVAALQRETQNARLTFRSSFSSARYPAANWPSPKLPGKFGKFVWRENSPHFQIETPSWQMRPGERRTHYLRLKAPAQPWTAQMSGWVFAQAQDPFEATVAIPVTMKIKDFHSRFTPGDDTDPPDSDTPLDPKPNFEAESVVPPPQEFRLLGIYPNPFTPSIASQSVRVRFFLPNAAALHAEIFDVMGRRIANLAWGEFSGGEHVLIWNGQDEHGRKARAGIYFIRLSADERTALKKILLLHAE